MKSRIKWIFPRLRKLAPLVLGAACLFASLPAASANISRDTGREQNPAPADQQQPLDISQNYNTVGEHSFILLEDQPLSLIQARAAFAEGKFTAASSSVPSFALQKQGAWMKFDVHNPDTATHKRRLSFLATWINSVEVSILHQGNIVYQHRTGDEQPVQSRQPFNRLFVFEHDFAPGTSEVYLHVQSHEPLVLPVSLHDIASAERQAVTRAYGYGILYGILIGLLLFNLLIYLSIRQQRYLYYVFYLAAYLLMDISYTGHGYLYFWPDAASWQHWAPTFSVTLYATAGILFALSFLRMRELYPRIHRLTLRFILVLFSLQILLTIGNMGQIAIAIALIYVMLFSLLTFYFAIISFRKGHTDAVYYLVATFATLIGAAVSVFSVTGILPFTDLTYHAGEIAVAFDSILLSIALAEQIRRAQNEKLAAQHQARTDILTRLSNRLAFDEISGDIWRRAEQQHSPLCFIMLDIDHFKHINDQYGHATGDVVLQKISQTLQTIVREADVLVRWGGEEFAMILPHTSLRQAEKLAERIRQSIEKLDFTAAQTVFKVTVSLGVAEKSAQHHSMNDLFKQADSCLYQAKQEGRNRVVIASETMLAETMKRSNNTDAAPSAHNPV